MEEEKDDISIDFSKITGFFKRKKEPKPTEKKPEKDKPDREEEKPEKESAGEAGIDLTAIKKFFKREKKEAKEEKAAEKDEVSFDIKGIGSFFTRNTALVLLIIALLVAFYLRLVPMGIPVTDDWAKSSVDSFLKSQIRAQIDSSYPNLPDANKADLVEEEFSKFAKQNNADYKAQISATSNYFKSRFQDDDGNRYIPNIDPYFWLRHARNVVKNGHPGDELRPGPDSRMLSYDSHMIAPLGRYLPTDMLNAYLGAYAFMLMRIFSPGIRLESIALFLPVLLSALAVIPAFFIARKISGNAAGFIAAIIVAVHPAFVARTTAGSFDTDPFNILFPLFIAWLFLIALESSDARKSALYAVIAGFLVGLYSFGWGGWWFMLDICLAAGITYLVYIMIVRRSELKKSFKIATCPIVAVIALLLASGVFVTAFTDFDTFSFFYNAPRAFTEIKAVGTYTVWPNVFTTVAEQNELDVTGIINNSGGKVILFLSLIGVLLSFFALKGEPVRRNDLYFIICSAVYYSLFLYFMPSNVLRAIFFMALPVAFKLIEALLSSRRLAVGYAVIVFVWLAAPFYASTKGIRWILLLVPAVALGAGVCLGFLYSYLKMVSHKEFGISNKVFTPLMLFIVLLLIGSLIGNGYSVAYNEVPLVDDAWYESLDYIRQNSSENAIITSWWDFGHWFKEIADRPVTFDGTSQDTPMAHWVGKILQTDDENLAVGLLRMLDCGSNNAFDELDKAINKTYKSVELIYGIVVLNKSQADSLLRLNSLSSEQASKVLSYTHCEPPEAYFITSGDMVGKAGVWSHFGLWDFRKSTMFNTVRNNRLSKDDGIRYLAAEFNISEANATRLYFEMMSLDAGSSADDWIAPRPLYYSAASCRSDNITLTCPLLQATVKIDLKSHDAVIPSQKGEAYPVSIVYPADNGIVERKFSGNTIDISIILVPQENNQYSIIPVTPQLAGSMFTRLFFLEGHGLSHFKLVSSKRTIFNEQVIVWKLDWNGTGANVMNVFNKVNVTEEKLVKEEETALPATDNGSVINLSALQG